MRKNDVVLLRTVHLVKINLPALGLILHPGLLAPGLSTSPLPASAPRSARCGFPSLRGRGRTRRPQSPARPSPPEPRLSSGRPGACAALLRSRSRLSEAWERGRSGRTPVLCSRHSPKISARDPCPPTDPLGEQARHPGNCEGGCRRVSRMLFKVCR